MSEEPVKFSKTRKGIAYFYTAVLAVCVIGGTALFIALVQAILK